MLQQGYPFSIEDNCRGCYKIGLNKFTNMMDVILKSLKSRNIFAVLNYNKYREI